MRKFSHDCWHCPAITAWLSNQHLRLPAICSTEAFTGTTYAMCLALGPVSCDVADLHLCISLRALGVDVLSLFSLCNSCQMNPCVRLHTIYIYNTIYYVTIYLLFISMCFCNHIPSDTKCELLVGRSMLVKGLCTAFAKYLAPS